MKILKILLGIIVLLSLMFFALGYLIPSTEYYSEITVDKPIDEAWAVMNDESKISDWLEGIVDVKHVSGEKGAVGAVTEYTFEQNGQSSKVLETIKSITPQQQVKMDFRIPGAMVMAYTVDFIEHEAKTKIKSTTVVSGEGLFMKSLVPIMKGSMVGQEDANMDRLKNLINGNTTNYFPEPEPPLELVVGSEG